MEDCKEFKKLRERLAKTTDPPNPVPGSDAAVAVLLRQSKVDGGLEVLLMVRSERDGDPWSGQVSLPGGKAEKQDRSLLETATRETKEELGVDVSAVSKALGALASLQPYSQDPQKRLSVTPFIFEVTQKVSVVLGPEAFDSFWLPLTEAVSGAFDKPYIYRSDSGDVTLPSWHYNAQTVWGLTHRILTSVGEAAR